MAVIFLKNKPQRCKIEMKNEVKTFFFLEITFVRGAVISKKKKKKRKKGFHLVLVSVRFTASTVFPTLALRVKSLPTSGLAYFSHLTPLVLFFFTKRPSQKEGPWHNAPP